MNDQCLSCLRLTGERDHLRSAIARALTFYQITHTHAILEAALSPDPILERTEASVLPQLHALIAKWRELHSDPMTFWHSVHPRDVLRQCADELETALGEASVRPPQHEWRCFHCDEVFTTPGAAGDHFGATEGAGPGCLIDRVALEEGGKPERGRGLLMALRKSEVECDQWQARALSAEERAEGLEGLHAENMRLTKGHGVFMALDYLEGEKLVLQERVRELEKALGEARVRLSPPPQAEVCICAAVLTEEGLTIRGHRHHDAMRAAGLAFCTPKRGADAQGFITSRNRYVDRCEGRRLQEAAGIGSVAPGGYRGEELFSEDLY